MDDDKVLIGDQQSNDHDRGSFDSESSSSYQHDSQLIPLRGHDHHNVQTNIDLSKVQKNPSIVVENMTRESASPMDALSEVDDPSAQLPSKFMIIGQKYSQVNQPQHAKNRLS